jgi:hypothetical protein
MDYNTQPKHSETTMFCYTNTNSFLQEGKSIWRTEHMTATYPNSMKLER